jgi:hypothetical protein
MMRKFGMRPVSIFISLLCMGIVFAVPSGAFENDPTSSYMVLPLEPSEPVVLAIDSPLLGQFDIDPTELNATDRKILSNLSEEGLWAFMNEEDPNTIYTLQGDSLAVLASQIGEITEEMVFTPLPPCRLIDTRFAVGDFAPGETRTYDLIGLTNYSIYGGNSSGCGIPVDTITTGFLLSSTNKVRALALNLVAVSSGGGGHLEAWPANQAPTGASVLNYATVPFLSMTNGLVLQTCDANCTFFPLPGNCPPCSSQGGDLSIRANVSSTHLVVDVMGYFTPATISGVAGFTNENTFVGAPFLNISDGACHNVTSVLVTNTSDSQKSVVCTGETDGEFAHVNGTTDEYQINIATNGTTCSGPQPGTKAAGFEIPSAYPTASGIDMSLNVTGHFPLAANTSATYFLNARMSQGGSTPTDAVINAELICVFTP